MVIYFISYDEKYVRYDKNKIREILKRIFE